MDTPKSHRVKRKNSSTGPKLTNSFTFKLSWKVAVSASLLLIDVLHAGFDNAEGVLVQTPTNTTVAVNHSTFFNCSKSNENSNELTWYHYTADGKANGVYERGRIKATYEGRFDVDKNITSGICNLLVLRPETTDAGTYECREDRLVKGASAELVVLDSYLICEANIVLHEVVGLTQCDKSVASDKPLLSCSVNYSGNVAPQMKWTKYGIVSNFTETECSVIGNHVICNTTLDSNLSMGGSLFVCQVTAAEHYNCSSKVSKTIYTFPDYSVENVTLMDVASCSANTRPELSCSYKWLKDNKTEQSGQKLKPNKTGKYTCEATCIIRNGTCSFTAKEINVVESALSRPSTSTGNRTRLELIIPLAIVAAVLFTIVAAVTYYCWKKRTPAEGTQSVPLMTAASKSNKTDEDEVIRRACIDGPPIAKGSNGHIFGPGLYKGNKCAYERILLTEDQNTLKNKKDGMTEVEKVIKNGEKWMKLMHTNLIKIHHVALISESVYIVMEYAAGKSVQKALQIYEKALPMPMVRDWAIQIAEGLCYLHEKNIVHKNITSSQIFILEELKEPPDLSNKTLKIGCNYLGSDSLNNTSLGQQGLSSSSTDGSTEKGFTKKSDALSFSIVVLELLTGKPPQQIVQGCDKITKFRKIPSSCPQELERILNDCNHVKPSKRPTFVKILKCLKEWKL